MDAVRFGRALGFGARQAAKTVISAVDAARAENPSGPQPQSAAAPNPAPPTPAAMPTSASSAPIAARSIVAPVESAPSAAPHRAAQTAAHVTTQVRGVQEGISRFKASAVEPVVRLSGVLWLEVAGVFFGVFALSTAIAIWRLRAEWRPALVHPAAHVGVLIAAAVFALFTYFCVSSFIRARRRERRRS